jgi:hypothetical protein
MHGQVELVHFKNDNKKGPQHMPLAKGTIKVMAMLEQASAFMATQCPGGVSTLFYGTTGHPYQPAYFSTVVSNLLTMYGVRCTANTFRHFFSTAWRDFISSPTTQLVGFTIHQLEEVAASMMLNSTDAWATSYDDSTMDRGMHSILALWPKFLTFVYEHHLDKVTEEPWDPLTATMAELSME